MRRSRSVLVVVVLGLSGALVGVVPHGASAVPARARCRSTAVVTNTVSGTVSTIDVKTRTKSPTDIPVGPLPAGMAVTPDGKTLFVSLRNSATVSTIDVKTRTKNPTDIPVGAGPGGVAVTPDGKTAFVANFGGAADSSNFGSGNSVSTIDLKTRTKHPTDITVGDGPFGVVFTPCRR